MVDTRIVDIDDLPKRKFGPRPCGFRMCDVVISNVTGSLPT